MATIRHFLLALGALWLAACGSIPLPPAQRLSGAYIARETGDMFTFSHDGTYTYTIGGPASHAYSGYYRYNDSGELKFTYALSSHCGLWKSGRVSQDKSRIAVELAWRIGTSPEIQNTSPYRIGTTLHFVQQRASGARDH